LDPQQKVTVYSADQANNSFKKIFKETFSGFWQANELGIRLFKRNLKALYRQSFLGFAWALIPPLVTAALWVFLRNNVVSVGETDMPYTVFVITGTLLWQIFAESLQSPIKNVQLNKNILIKINFKREGLLLSGLYEVLFNVVIKIVLLVLVLVAFQYHPSFQSINLFIDIAFIIICGFSIGLILVPVAMLYQDIQKGITVILPFLMYLTPVVYPMPKEGTAAKLLQFNPMAVYINDARDMLIGNGAFFKMDFILLSVFFVVLVLLGYIMFHIAMPIIIERSGS